MKKIFFILGLGFLVSCSVERHVYHGNTVIRTEDPVNEKVGYHYGELARKRAEEFLCIDPESYNIIIIEVNKSKNRIPTYENAVVLPWMFPRESYIDVQSITTDEKVAYYTRSTGPNSPIPHELGHFIWAKYIIDAGKKSKRKQKQYGTMAPDWLDESVAILFESDDDKMLRRVQFHDSLRQGQNFSIGQLTDAQHPSWRVKQEGNKDISSKLESKTPDSQSIGAYDDIILFYLQSYMFADYLIENSGNSCILANLGKEIAKKTTFIEWLENQEELTDVNSLEELEEDFQKWVKEDSTLYPDIEEWIEQNLVQDFVKNQ